jgi:hypothetical protein
LLCFPLCSLNCCSWKLIIILSAYLVCELLLSLLYRIFYSMRKCCLCTCMHGV